MSEINVTPLVDVVLVLLIVFMITVPAIVGTAQIKVDLPETSSAVAAPASDLTLTVFVRRADSGEIAVFLEDRQVTDAELKQVVEKLGLHMKDVPVAVAADKTVSYGELVKVIDLLGSLGIEKLALDTRHREKLDSNGSGQSGQ